MTMLKNFDEFQKFGSDGVDLVLKGTWLLPDSQHGCGGA